MFRDHSRISSVSVRTILRIRFINSDFISKVLKVVCHGYADKFGSTSRLEIYKFCVYLMHSAPVKYRALQVITIHLDSYTFFASHCYTARWLHGGRTTSETSECQHCAE